MASEILGSYIEPPRGAFAISYLTGFSYYFALKDCVLKFYSFV